MKIRIVVADDHQIVRDGLRSLLQQQPDTEVIAEAQNGHELVELVRNLRPDVAIIDLSMPELNGIEATRMLMNENFKTKIIVLSMHSDRHYVAEVLKAGASGYVVKNAAFEELSHAIHDVLSGHTYLSRQIERTVLTDYVHHLRKEDSSAFSILTDRERQVLQLVAEGKITKEIASQLKISVKTVETYRARIMEKLNLETIPDLVKYAIRHGLTSIE